MRKSEKEQSEEENEILMQKKGKSGKNGIYGAILVPIIQA